MSSENVVNFAERRAARQVDETPPQPAYEPLGREERRFAQLYEKSIEFSKRLGTYGLHDVSARRVKQYLEGEILNGHGHAELDELLAAEAKSGHYEYLLLSAVDIYDDDETDENTRRRKEEVRVREIIPTALSWAAAKCVLDTVARLRARANIGRNPDSYQSWQIILNDLTLPMGSAAAAKILDLGANEDHYFRVIEPERFAYGASLLELEEMLTWRLGLLPEEAAEAMEKIHRQNHREFIRKILGTPNPEHPPIERLKDQLLALGRALPMVDPDRICEFIQGIPSDTE